VEINRTNYRDYLNSTNVINNSKSSRSVEINSSTTEKNKDREIDIHNATFDEFKQVVHDLHQSGEISFLEFATYVFQPMKGNTIESGRRYADGNNRNWIAEFRSKSASNLKNGNIQSYIEDQKLLRILTD
jgi:hypothetical protein